MALVEVRGTKDLVDKLNSIMSNLFIGLDDGLEEVGKKVTEFSTDYLKENVQSPKWPKPDSHKILEDKNHWVITGPRESTGAIGREVLVGPGVSHAVHVEFGTGDIKPKGPYMRFITKEGNWVTIPSKEKDHVTGQPGKFYLSNVTTKSSTYWPTYLNIMAMSLSRRLV